MKKLFALILLAGVAFAGDDYVATVAYTGTAACSSILKAKSKYAVRCTTDCYAMVSATGDSTNTATTNHVLLTAGKLYDLPTTATQRYICAIQSSAGGNLLIYLNRSINE